MGHHEFFEDLREVARKAAKVESEVLPSLFLGEDNLRSQIIIYCPDRGYISAIHKLGWILGKRLCIITPFIAYHYCLTESGSVGAGISKDECFLDPAFFEWKSQLLRHMEDL